MNMLLTHFFISVLLLITAGAEGKCFNSLGTCDKIKNEFPFSTGEPSSITDYSISSSTKAKSSGFKQSSSSQSMSSSSSAPGHISSKSSFLKQGSSHTSGQLPVTFSSFKKKSSDSSSSEEDVSGKKSQPELKTATILGKINGLTSASSQSSSSKSQSTASSSNKASSFGILSEIRDQAWPQNGPIFNKSESISNKTKESKPSKGSSSNGITSSSRFKQSSSSSSSAPGFVSSKSSFTKKGSSYSSNGELPVTFSSFKKKSSDSSDKDSSSSSSEEDVSDKKPQPVLKTPTLFRQVPASILLSTSQRVQK